MCNFCDMSNEKGETEEGDITYYIVWNKYDLQPSLYCDTIDNFGDIVGIQFPIKHCPMCGRNLIRDWKALDEIWACVMCGKSYDDLSNDQKQTLVDFKDLTYEEFSVAAKHFQYLSQMKATIDSIEPFLNAAKSGEKVTAIMMACLIYNR